jgi:hypothetical protein
VTLYMAGAPRYKVYGPDSIYQEEQDMHKMVKYDERQDLIDPINGTEDADDEKMWDSVTEFDRHSVRAVLGWGPYTHLVVGTSDSDPEIDCWMQVAYLVDHDPSGIR